MRTARQEFSNRWIIVDIKIYLDPDDRTVISPQMFIPAAPDGKPPYIADDGAVGHRGDPIYERSAQNAGA